MKKTKISILILIAIASTTALADSSVWQWSNSGQYYSYRDNDGRVHYSDGSIGEPTETWTNNEGKTVYRANSAGPKDKTGQYAVQQPRIDESSVGPAPKNPPANAVLTTPDPNKPTFGPTSNSPTYIVPSGNTTNASTGSNNGTYEFSIKPTPGNSVVNNTNTSGNNNSNSIWQWSNSGQYYYYRDNDGRVHYSDGSVSEPNEVWTNNEGKTVYRANSAGPKDQTGQYAIQQSRIDDSNVGAAPSSPPSNAVLVRPNPNEPTFGPAPTEPIYVTPESQMKPHKQNNNYATNQNTSTNSNANSQQDLNMPGIASGVDNNMLMKAIEQAKNQGGDFNSIVSNPFVFCSGPKPKKGNPLRVVYDMICGDSQKNGQNASSTNTTLTPKTPSINVK